MVTHSTRATIGLLGVAVTIGRAQAPRQPLPPVRPLGHIIATTSAPIQRVAQVRVLSDGRILVHDMANRRVLLFDSSLALARSIIDTTGTTRKAYGEENGVLFPYSADSSLFLDQISGALLVLDPAGTIARLFAAPENPLRPRFGTSYLVQQTTAFDHAGHFLFVQATPRDPRDVSGLVAAPPPDSAIVPGTSALLRIGLVTRREDTLATLTQSPKLFSGRIMTVNPLAEADRWTVLNDGTVAIVRAHDYHIDWIAPDGTVASSPRIAHEWRHLTDSLKVAFIDSARTADSLRSQAQVDSEGGMLALVKAQQVRAQAGPNQHPQTDSQVATFLHTALFPPYVPAWALPDYVPPFPAAFAPGDLAVSADADDDVWIRVGHPGIQGGDRVYDVVSRQGVLVDRVQLPGGTSIVGFGPGVVYLAAREGSGMQIARARIR